MCLTSELTVSSSPLNCISISECAAVFGVKKHQLPLRDLNSHASRILSFPFLNNSFRKEINHSLSDYLFVFISVTYCPSLMTLDRWIPSNYPITENIRAIYLTLEKLIQSEETQVNGIVILADYKGVSLSKASHFGPFIAKKVIGILQVWPLCVLCLSCPVAVWFPQGPVHLPLIPPDTQTPPPLHSQNNRKALWEET